MAVVEKDVPDAHITGRVLSYTASDRWILDASGGEEKASMRCLEHVHYVMDLGEHGPSHRDGRSNFAYVRSMPDRRLWAVHWLMNAANEWVVGAAQVPHPDVDWRLGSRFFSSQSNPDRPS
jgi:hypothetical protein